MAGEKDKSIEWLEKGFEARDPNDALRRNVPYDFLHPDEVLLPAIRESPHGGAGLCVGETMTSCSSITGSGPHRPWTFGGCIMICPNCHAENRDDSKFCGNCAAPLGRGGCWGGPGSGLGDQDHGDPLRVLSRRALIAGKYRIVEEVGAGGMGVVYKAEDLKLKRAVALKFLPPHLMDAPELKERFLIEAQAAAALSHPNICVIHEVGESEDRPYIAMEYVEGETLRDRVRKGPLEPGEAVDIIRPGRGRTGEAHGKGIIHRDVKSANIMVTAKGRAKVMDFGLAKLRGGSSLTKSQTTIGTVAYMSPEQARGEELDQRTDIWSLGVALYEMLTGELPFKGDHDQTVIHAILHKAPKPPSKVRPDLPSGLDEIVLKALVQERGEPLPEHGGGPRRSRGRGRGAQTDQSPPSSDFPRDKNGLYLFRPGPGVSAHHRL
jgi:serine/threonine protein kinase